MLWIFSVVYWTFFCITLPVYYAGCLIVYTREMLARASTVAA